MIKQTFSPQYISNYSKSDNMSGTIVKFTLDPNIMVAKIGDTIKISGINAGIYKISKIEVNNNLSDYDITAVFITDPFQADGVDEFPMNTQNSGLVRLLKWHIGPFKPICFMPWRGGDEIVLVAFYWPFYQYYTWKVSITDNKGAFFQYQLGRIGGHPSFDIRIGRLVFRKRGRSILNLEKKGNMHIIPVEWSTWRWFW